MLLLLHIISLLVFIYLASCVAYLLFFAVAGSFSPRTRYSTHPQKSSMLILIPSYKEDKIIVDTARRAIAHNYPSDCFEVCVIADSLQPETLAALDALPVKVHRVHFEKSTKAKALKSALSAFSEDAFDILVILDADNVMADHCLEKINHAFQLGHRAVQAHRLAKNKNTPFALLDAASEEMNNTIFRKGQRVVGLASALIGSGMAFGYAYFRNLMLNNNMDNNAGEDREIEMLLLNDGIRCEYINDALVYDEKVQNREVMQKQRSRWLALHFSYLGRCIEALREQKQLSSAHLNKLMQTIILPRIFLLALLALLCAMALLLWWTGHYGLLLPDARWWVSLFPAYITALVVALPRSFYTRDFLKALMHVPSGLWAMLLALTKMKGKQTEFVHTPKDIVER
jgi:cellulose synthase/poly-beta-1,6-N-acetylglucosamine synthase-like glycosyltransferase